MIGRTRVAAGKIASSTADFFTASGIKFGRRSPQVRVANKTAHLTPKEMRLFRYLISTQGRTVTHQELLSAVWGAKSVRRLNYVHVSVSNLRKENRAGSSLSTIPPDRAGYSFSIPDQPEET